MSSNFEIPSWVAKATCPGVYGDIDAFMDEYERGEMAREYTRLERKVERELNVMVLKAIRFYYNGTPPDQIPDEELSGYTLPGTEQP